MTNAGPSRDRPGGGDVPSTSRSRREWPKKKPRKLTLGLVGLSSAAIVSVYATGYLNTRAADQRLTAQAPIPTATATQTVPPRPRSVDNAPRRQTGGIPGTPIPAPTRAQGSAPQAVSYRDGTFVGFGSSRHGSIEATVVITGGKITSAAITSCGTRYPCSRIALLPGQVVARQGGAVDYVSGATDSSQAYVQAVTSALAQARAG